jgi:hypothetical protein
MIYESLWLLKHALGILLTQVMPHICGWIRLWHVPQLEDFEHLLEDNREINRCEFNMVHFYSQADMIWRDAGADKSPDNQTATHIGCRHNPPCSTSHPRHSLFWLTLIDARSLTDSRCHSPQELVPLLWSDWSHSCFRESGLDCTQFPRYSLSLTIRADSDSAPSSFYRILFHASGLTMAYLWFCLYPELEKYTSSRDELFVIVGNTINRFFIFFIYTTARKGLDLSKSIWVNSSRNIVYCHLFPSIW